MPKWSMAMYSDMEKQSWVSMPSSAPTPGMLRPPEGVGDDLADVREDVGLPLAAVELGLQRQRGGAVPPAGDAGERLSTEPFGPIAVGDQQHAGRAVGDLGAVGAAKPALDDRVVAVVAGESARAERPAAGLRQRVALGVAHVDLGDGVQVRVVQPVTPVVLVGELTNMYGQI